MIGIRTKLFFIALFGSIVSWLLITTFIMDMNVLQFLVIEFIIALSHYFYNDVKIKFQE
jgi:hypothetical protein